MIDGTTLAAVVTALVTGAAGYATARRATKPAELGAATSAHTALLASYDVLAERLQGEVERVRRDCAERISAMQRQHDEEREEWRQERRELNERIDELGSIVYALRNRPTETREREDDRP